MQELRMFKTALFMIGNKWKQPKCQPTEKWIKKLCVYIYREIDRYIDR